MRLWTTHTITGQFIKWKTLSMEFVKCYNSLVQWSSEVQFDEGEITKSETTICMLKYCNGAI